MFRYIHTNTPVIIAILACLSATTVATTAIVDDDASCEKYMQTESENVCIIKILPCDWKLRTNTERICMSTTQHTHPALAANLYGTTYYANLGPDNHSSIKVQYGDQVLSVYDNPDKYELIHWLSGEDALVDNIWIDRMAATTTDTGPLNFRNHGCKRNDDHTGYYTERGDSQYFATDGKPSLNFGTDWYIEITANINCQTRTAYTACTAMDLGSVASPSSGTYTTGISYNPNAACWQQNTKPGGNGRAHKIINCIPYTGDKVKIIFGATASDTPNQSYLYTTIPYADNDTQFGNLFNTVTWDKWFNTFYLFRGLAATSFAEKYYCDSGSTIYDIKVWRKNNF